MKIGVALGSGSARGWSHIGVLKQLQAMGVQPHVVAGTSIGALVGAFYAAERLQALEDWVTEFGWREVVSLLDVKFSGGIIEGRKVFEFFEQQMPDFTFDSLTRPFACVATDLESGREIWLQHGKLAQAVRASISVPGLFNPYQAKNGRFLVDGGLVNPVPVSLCRALGADVVIAVNLNSEIVGKHMRNSRVASEEFTAESEKPGQQRSDHEEIRQAESDFFKKVSLLFSTDNGNGDVGTNDNTPPGMMDVMATSLNIMQDRITRSRMAGDPADLVLNPRLSHIGLMEYYRAEEAIAAGVNTVQLAERQLQNLLGDDIRLPQ